MVCDARCHRQKNFLHLNCNLHTNCLSTKYDDDFFHLDIYCWMQWTDVEKKKNHKLFHQRKKSFNKFSVSSFGSAKQQLKLLIAILCLSFLKFVILYPAMLAFLIWNGRTIVFLIVQLYRSLFLCLWWPRISVECLYNWRICIHSLSHFLTQMIEWWMTSSTTIWMELNVI